MRAVLLLISGVLGLAPAACSPGPTESPDEPLGEGRPVLFIGNSYLYTQDIPGIVQALADSAGGDKLAVRTVAYPDYALIDHWNSGAARAEIARGGWEWVVLQQGPSSVEINRDTLRLATGYFATDLVRIGARPALFSAWPQSNRRQDFARAIESYTIAAQDVNGLLLPAAGAWLAAWDRSPGLALYADGLHPSVEGAYLSALVVFARLLDQPVTGLPARLSLRNGRIVALDPAIAATLQAAATETLALQAAR
jgi:hypothetical protein